MYKHYNSITYLVIAGYFFFTACANPVSPNGGPKDEEPPQVVLEASSPNMQTNFEKRSFELTFNEWVKLNDPFNQVVVSPPLEYTPEVTLKKKTVRFEFDGKEKLRENATYIINFGEAVKDFNEGLAAENLRFVFSTGDYIDSLSVRGKVTDAFSGDPIDDVLVLLYDNLADSVVRTERPFYFGRTSKSGTFQIDNVRADTFKIFALDDNNFNYLFDMPLERIGYQEEPFILTDSIRINIELQLFEEEQPLRIVSKNSDRYGKITFNFNKKPTADLQITFDSVLQRQQIVYEKDSIHLWYQPKDSVGWSVYIQQDTFLYDTVKIKPRSKTAFLAKAKLDLRKKVRSKIANQNPRKAMELRFNHPLIALDTAAFVLLEDTTEIRVKPNVRLVLDTVGLVKMRYKWAKAKPYKMIILPGAVTDWYGLKNDSIVLDFTVPAVEDFGNLIVKMTELEDSVAYVLQLFKGEELVEESTFQADSVYTKKYIGMLPATYKMRVVRDANANGKWDPGNYDLKTQSEKLYFRTLGELRADWDLEVDFSMETKKEVEKPKENVEEEKKEEDFEIEEEN
ncbi:MAG: Ig-like domain-containing protein [Saprospiraceae bacterium]